MQRAQVILEPWQYDTLKARSEKDGCSLSAMVREALSLYLGRSPQADVDPLDAIIGLGNDPVESGRTHDRYVYRPVSAVPKPKPKRRGKPLRGRSR